MNLFQSDALQEIVSRLNKVSSSSPAQWGKMNASQMMAHCQGPFQAFFGEVKQKRGLVGVLFGPLVKKQFLSDKPWKQGLPTAPEFRIADNREFEKEKEKLLDYIERFAKEGPAMPTSVHPFFGKMSAQDWARLSYNHLNHHLKQFGA